MSHYSLLNELLEKQGASIIKENATKKASAKKNVAKTDKKKLNESDILYQELDKLTENAIKDTLRSTIMESVLPDNIKLNQTEAISRVSLKEDEILGFMNDTIDPIIETVGTFNDSKVVKASNKKALKSVSIPVYEVALTLEAARLGALTEESLEDVAVKDDVEPVIDEVGANAEANAAKENKVDPNETTLTDLVEPEDDGNYYTFGELKEITQDDLMDVHQYEDFESMGGDKQLDTADEKSYDDESDIEEYEGEEAGGDEELFDAPIVESKATVLARLMRGLNENMEGETEEVEVEQKDNDTVVYVGKEAGAPGPGENAAGELEGDGTSDEAIVEQQLVFARRLLGNIFKEYGIKNKAAQRTVVREAMHYIFKYGAKNLVPSYSDVSQLVIEQNKISDLHNMENSRLIVDFTKPVLTPVQEVTIQNKSLEYLTALAASKELTKEASMKLDSGKISNQSTVNKLRRQLEEAANIREAVAYVLRANEIERTRQAFRHRMHHFNEGAKKNVANSWIIKEANNSEIARQLKDQLTVRKFVTEAVYVKRDCQNLNENNPIAKPELYKKTVSNASLPIAALVTEVACVWKYMKRNFYNNQPLGSKKLALEAMTNILGGYLNIFDIPTAKKDIKVVFENFEYRLQSLKDKVNIRLNEAKDPLRQPLDTAGNRPAVNRQGEFMTGGDEYVNTVVDNGPNAVDRAGYAVQRAASAVTRPFKAAKRGAQNASAATSDAAAAALGRYTTNAVSGNLDGSANIDRNVDWNQISTDLEAVRLAAIQKAKDLNLSGYEKRIMVQNAVADFVKNRYNTFDQTDKHQEFPKLKTGQVAKDAGVAAGIAAGAAGIAVLINKILKNNRATNNEKLAALRVELDKCKTDSCREAVQKAIASLAA